MSEDRRKTLGKFAPAGTTHALLLGGIQKPCGFYSMSLRWVKCEGSQIYFYETDCDNEYPEWVNTAGQGVNAAALAELLIPV